jgi:hypothetical protein
MGLSFPPKSMCWKLHPQCDRVRKWDLMGGVKVISAHFHDWLNADCERASSSGVIKLRQMETYINQKNEDIQKRHMC